MKMVISVSFEGFRIPQEVWEMVKSTKCEHPDDIRTDPRLIDWVLHNPDQCDSLIVVEVPDGYTDYYIEEYDGWESLLYVLNGKIYFASEVDQDGV